MLPEQPVSDLLDSIQIADELGYYACYCADEIYHKDAWLLLAAAARTTKQVRLGPCVSPILMRDPSYVAQLAATLDELSDGRTEIVFGIGNIAMLEQYGVQWRGTRPIARTNSTVVGYPSVAAVPRESISATTDSSCAQVECNRVSNAVNSATNAASLS